MKHLTFLGVAIVTFGSTAHADPAACADSAERAQVVRDEGKLVASRELLVSCAQQDCPKAVRDSCTEWLADVERRIPKIVVNARDARGRDVEVRASIDGAPLPSSVSVSAVRADPGRHKMRYESDGYPPREEEIILREAEGVRVLAVTFGGATPATQEPSSRPTTLTWVLGGTAVVGLGVFTAFGLMGVSEYKSLEGDCSPRCSRDRIDGVRDRFVVADIGLVVGLLAAGGTALTLLWGGAKVDTARR